MDIRRLSDRYAVSPQVAPEDMPALRDAGFATVLCNRPDGEVPPDLQAEAIRGAAEAAGLAFVDNPVTHAGLGPETIAAQRRALEGSSGPVLAYCASGTRSTIVWMLGQAEETAPDALLEAARRHGYELDMLRPQLEAIHRG